MFKDETSIAVGVGAINVLGVATSATVFGISEHALSSFIGPTVTVSALVMAIFGSLLALGIAKPLQPRDHMWKIFIASFVMGAVVTAVLPHLPFVKHIVLDAPPGPVALLTSFFSRWALPVVIEETPKRLKSLITGNPVPKDPNGE